MRTELKKDFDRLAPPEGFIKTTDHPVGTLTDSQKVALNRKGNMYFNQGDYLSARRLFITTGYSDGLTRLADVSMEQGNQLDALKLYTLAHNKRQADVLVEKLAAIISKMIE